MLVMLNGRLVSWVKVVLSMDDSLASTIDNIRPCTEQEYLDAYARAHEQAHGQPFQVKGD